MSQGSNAAPLATRWPYSLRSLAHSTYRRFLGVQMISLAGNWVQNFALVWLIVTFLGGSGTHVGWFTFASQIPILLLGIPAGSLADNFNRLRILRITQVLFFIHGLTLALIILAPGSNDGMLVTMPLVMIFAVIGGILLAIDHPARQAFIPQLVPIESLPNAIALNSLSFNLARTLGPAIAGLIIELIGSTRGWHKGTGIGLCLLLHALSYIPVLYILFKLQAGQFPVPRHAVASRIQYLTDGIRYVGKHPHLTAIHGHIMVMALFGIPYLTLVPLFAIEVLDGDARTTGYLTGAVGIGALAGGWRMAQRRGIVGLGRFMLKCVGGFTVFLVMFAWSSHFWLSAMLVGVAGYFMVMAMIASQTLMQILVPEKLRGRVMSFYSMIAFGLVPFGSLLSGWMADKFSVPWAFTVNSVACMLVSLYYTRQLPVLQAHAETTEEYKKAVAEP